jgi:hypothetical protein
MGGGRQRPAERFIVAWCDIRPTTDTRVQKRFFAARLRAEAERHAPSRGGAEMNGARIDGRSSRLDD